MSDRFASFSAEPLKIAKPSRALSFEKLKSGQLSQIYLNVEAANVVIAPRRAERPLAKRLSVKDEGRVRLLIQNVAEDQRIVASRDTSAARACSSYPERGSRP